MGILGNKRDRMNSIGLTPPKNTPHNFKDAVKVGSEPKRHPKTGQTLGKSLKGKQNLYG